MITGSIENFKFYFEGLEGMDEFMASLLDDTDIAEGKHTLDEDNIFAIVSRYSTRPRSECRPETHKKYVDIQMLLSGHEIIECSALNEKTHVISEAYDSDKDVAFYELPKSIGTQVVLSKGTFAVFFPHDAHMPQMNYDKAEEVLKVVIKIKADLL